MKKALALVLALVLVLCSASALAATGVGMVTSVTTTAATADKAGTVSVNTTVCALTLDENGVITGIRFDVVQPKGSFDTAGAVVGDATSAPDSKVIKGDAYGMKKASAIGKEWFEQAAFLEEWCIGKTVEEVLGMPTAVKNEEHNCVPAGEDVLAGCTIDVGSFLKALEIAAAGAR